MSTRCELCGEAFEEGDKVQQLPPILELRRGEKSGELGWYVSPNSQTDAVHIECVQGFYQIENTPEWDSIDTNLRERVREEEREEIREEVAQEIAMHRGLMCMECMEEMSSDELEDMFTELMDKILNDPDFYLAHISYTQAYELYVRFGHSLAAMHQRTQS